MCRLIFILTILTLLGFHNRSNPKHNSVGQPDKSKSTFATCFANLDTSKAGESIACSGKTFKLINERYVIQIFPDLPIQFDSCYTIIIDSLNGRRLTGLFVFNNKDANLTNICRDVLIINGPAPTKELYAQSGQIIIGFSDPTELYGNQTYHTTILIKGLVFIDSSTGYKIELENELLWKVLDLGTPG